MDSKTSLNPGASLDLGTFRPLGDRKLLIQESCTIITAFALLFVLTRMYTRICIVKPSGFGWDDGMMAVAMVTSLVGLAVILTEAVRGSVDGIAVLEPAQVKEALLLNFISQTIYLWAATLVKLSVAFLLHRITASAGWKKTFKCICGFLLLYTLVFFFILIFQCRPTVKLWDPTVQAKCFSPRAMQILGYVNSSISVTSDIVLAVLPVPMLWNTQLNHGNRYQAMGILSIASCACVASVIKAVYMQGSRRDNDFLYNSAKFTLWTVIECNAGIIAACISTLKPLVRRVLGLGPGDCAFVTPLDTFASHNDLVTPRRPQRVLQEPFPTALQQRSRMRPVEKDPYPLDGPMLRDSWSSKYTDNESSAPVCSPLPRQGRLSPTPFGLFQGSKKVESEKVCSKKACFEKA